MKILLLCFALVGCMDVKVSDSRHEVSGTATVRVVVGIDVTACEGLPPEDKLECIQSLIDLAKTLQESQSDLDALPMIH